SMAIRKLDSNALHGPSPIADRMGTAGGIVPQLANVEAGRHQRRDQLPELHVAAHPREYVLAQEGTREATLAGGDEVAVHACLGRQVTGEKSPEIAVVRHVLEAS